jgi:hypothetical protein
VSSILKVAAGVVAMVLVVVAGIVVYRETDLLTGSLVVLAGLMIAALLARRAAAREEKAGMADWEEETLASAEAAESFFGDWTVSPSRDDADIDAGTPSIPRSSPSVAPPVPSASNGPATPATPMPLGAEVPEPDDPSVAVSRPLRGEADQPQDTETLVASLFVTQQPPAPVDHDPDPFGVDQYISAPTPAFAGAGAPAVDTRSPIDWTGQGGRVDERVSSSDDILRVSEATAIPVAGEGGSELARLLAKVEARLRDYD